MNNIIFSKFIYFNLIQFHLIREEEQEQEKKKKTSPTLIIAQAIK